MLFRSICLDAGATAWLPRIEQRILRAGEVVPGRAAHLAPAELRVAELAGSGATNREIAATLYLSVKTVEATLSRIYRKLEVRSRTELANTMADWQPTPNLFGENLRRVYPFCRSGQADVQRFRHRAPSMGMTRVFPLMDLSGIT